MPESTDTEKTYDIEISMELYDEVMAIGPEGASFEDIVLGMLNKSP